MFITAPLRAGGGASGRIGPPAGRCPQGPGDWSAAPSQHHTRCKPKPPSMASVDLHHLKTLMSDGLQCVGDRLLRVPTHTQQVVSVQQSCKCATPRHPFTTAAALWAVKQLSMPTGVASNRDPTHVSNPCDSTRSPPIRLPQTYLRPPTGLPARTCPASIRSFNEGTSEAGLLRRVENRSNGHGDDLFWHVRDRRRSLPAGAQRLDRAGRPGRLLRGAGHTGPPTRGHLWVQTRGSRRTTSASAEVVTLASSPS